ncbi:MAG: ABC transporter substrate-binding protein [Acidobacteriota bacterium]|nr:ABC transporter substrate-binding protein [Acidobacteriota bacterium]
MTLAWLLLQVLAAEKLIYAAGYIPNVQFTPFYVADQRGYYAEEGIELKMDYTMGPDISKLVALGKVHIASADPDAFMHAAVRKLPLVNVATLYQTYPIAMIAAEDILNGEDLRGKRIGITGTYGSSYLGLKSMLAEMNLKLTDVRVVSIGYTQVAALKQGSVDAVVGYINNEPIRLEDLGMKVYTRMPGSGSRIPGVGLMTSRKFHKEKPQLVEGFLRATFRGMNDVLKDPRACYELVVQHYLPELKAKDRYDSEFKILQATLPYLTSDQVKTYGFGQCPEAAWQNLSSQLQRERGKVDYARWLLWVDRSFTWKPQ